MSTMMCFPTQVEIDAVGAHNAGEYLLSMQVDSPSAYAEFLDSRRPRHKDADGSDYDADGTGLKALFQPIWLTLKHLVHLLIRTVEHNTSAIKNDDAADGVVQEDEIRRFLKMRARGDALKLKANLDAKDIDFGEVRPPTARAGPLLLFTGRAGCRTPRSLTYGRGPC